METKKFMRAKELSEHLSIGLSTVWLYAKQQKITPIKLSEKVTVFNIAEVEKANNWLKKARERVPKIVVTEFSAWRYQYLSEDEFLKDLDAIQEMINGKAILPLFMTS